MRLLAAFLSLPLIGFLAGAVWFQFSGPARAGLLAALATAAVALAVLLVAGCTGAGWALLAALAAGGGVWWASLTPSNHRDWQDEVAHGVTGTVEAGVVELRHVRNFDWRSRADYTQAWETRRYILADLDSVDLVTSTWASPAIAHILVSFGFRGGGQIVFSAEIRKEKGEVYSNLGGFFRQFELALIAADEHDILRTRIDARGERVAIYRVATAPATREALLLSLVDLGNELAREPRFYNTVLSNCTTVLWRLVRTIHPGLPLDRRVLLSGYLPDYLHDLGALGPVPLAAIRARAIVPPGTGAGLTGPAYSAALREGRL